MSRLIMAGMLLLMAESARATDLTVSDSSELNAAMRDAKAGDRVLLAPGAYRGSFSFSGTEGDPDRPIIIASQNPEKQADIEGNLHLSRVRHLELRGITIKGGRGNGINIDDGGSAASPSHHITLRNIRVMDVGAGGNQDAIKLSGVDDFLIENVTVENWSRGGSGIDMVGCHRGWIERSTFRRGGNAIQAKGGSSGIVIRLCRFEEAESRGVNIGGSTGMPYFRPPVSSMPPSARYEAKDITVEQCTFVGGGAPFAFVGVDGAIVRRCTVYRPGRWAIRILQETTNEGFVPSRGATFEDNIVVFRSSDWASGGVNIGGGTAPQTFKFARNVWYCEDQPERSRPQLPTLESGGIYGQNPLFRSPESGDFRLQPGSPAKGRGAD